MVKWEKEKNQKHFLSIHTWIMASGVLGILFTGKNNQPTHKSSFIYTPGIRSSNYNLYLIIQGKKQVICIEWIFKKKIFVCNLNIEISWMIWRSSRVFNEPKSLDIYISFLEASLSKAQAACWWVIMYVKTQ